VGLTHIGGLESIDAMAMKMRRAAMLRSIALMSLSVAIAADEPADSPSNPVLRAELLNMVKIDQEARVRWVKSKNATEELLRISEEIDKPNTRRLKEIVDEFGWPGKSLVGRDGSSAAWLLVQHSGQNEIEFLERVLALMKQGSAQGEVALRDVAYLGDRIAMYQKNPQHYGTQYTEGPDGAMVRHPIEDEAHVDERRAAAGMPSMAEQEKRMSKFYGKPVRKSP
jgi:hypothetical protein